MTRKYTHDCIRTIAFTCPCDSEGYSDDATIIKALLKRIGDVAEHNEWQEASGQDCIDLRELEKDE